MSTPASKIPPALPLATEQLDALTALGKSMRPEALLWSSGYLAGLAAATGSAVTAPDAPAATQTESDAQLTILYGSQTGNGQRLAEELAVQAAQRSVSARIVNMADYRAQEIKKETAVALIVSTHGEGDPPDDAEALYEYLHSDRAPKLASLNYTVLALGDSSYAQFCQTGIDFDERLAELGASRLHNRVDCDTDYAAAAEAWADATLTAANEHLGASSVRSVPTLHAVQSARYTAEHPLAAEVIVNQKITGRASTKDVRHVEFDLSGSGLEYQPGDALGVVVANPPVLVDEFCDVLSLDRDIDVDGTSLATLLSERFEITVASRAFVERYAELAGSDGLKALLADDAREQLVAYIADRQIIDIVREHPSSPDAARFVECLRPLKPRLYSIASSPLVSEDEVAVTVAAVRYEAFGRPHWGAASTHLADRTDVGDVLSVYVEANPRFRLPEDPAAAVIMIGPGTGVAPFRAFLEHRDATGASGKNWLFFGDRNSREDFLYQLDWARYRKRGLLTNMDVAFSRDQADKVYVQDRLREHAAELFAWLEEGAHIYVCGDASQMAPDVHEALLDVIAAGLGKGRDAAEDYLKTLRRAGRYQRDVY
ncbi:MAG: assimilatory sulfite reductase (NADPH) flavoprotein subunit [Pseudomonadota bacterium]